MKEISMRYIENSVDEDLKSKMVSVVGPRQVGKTSGIGNKSILFHGTIISVCDNSRRSSLTLAISDIVFCQ